MCWAYFLDTLGCYLSFEPSFSTGIYDKYLSTSLIELNKISALATLCGGRRLDKTETVFYFLTHLEAHHELEV